MSAKFTTSILFAVSFLLLLCACGSGKDNVTHDDAPKKDSISPAVTYIPLWQKVKPPRPPEPPDDDSGDFIPTPRLIKSLSADTTIWLKSPFNKTAALKKLFPGRYYHVFNGSDVLDIEAWKCSTCGHKSFPGWFGGELNPFPDGGGDMTMSRDALKYIDDSGRKNIILSFSSAPVQSISMIAGRFACATLGLAWFTEKDSAWQLRTFTPALGCYGLFQDLPEIHLLKFGKNNFGCYLLSDEQTGAGSTSNTLFVFGVVNDTFRNIIATSFVKRFNTLNTSDWDMKIRSDTASDWYGDIYLTIFGNYLQQSFTDRGDNIDAVPDELEKAVKKEDNFDFIISRQYHFDGKSYQRLHSSVKKHPSVKKR